MRSVLAGLIDFAAGVLERGAAAARKAADRIEPAQSAAAPARAPLAAAHEAGGAIPAPPAEPPWSFRVLDVVAVAKGIATVRGAPQRPQRLAVGPCKLAFGGVETDAEVIELINTTDPRRLCSLSVFSTRPIQPGAMLHA